MAPRQVFSAAGTLMYTIQDVGEDQFVYDSSGALVYRYVRESNTTFDSSGNVVMRGNIVLDLNRR